MVRATAPKMGVTEVDESGTLLHLSDTELELAATPVPDTTGDISSVTIRDSSGESKGPARVPFS